MTSVIAPRANRREPRTGLHLEAPSLREKERLQLFRMGEDARPALLPEHTHTQAQVGICTEHWCPSLGECEHSRDLAQLYITSMGPTYVPTHVTAIPSELSLVFYQLRF